MPSADCSSPQARSRPSASSRTIARRTGSPTVRMIVARSRAAVSGWRIFTGGPTTDAIGAMIQVPKFHERGNMEARPPQMRRTLSPRLAYALAGAVIGLALFASITPSPLYGIYSELWDFSPVVLTLIYGTYAFGVLTTLILAGRVSDEVGRRPVLLVALGTLLATTVLYMLAQSVAWLFVARRLGRDRAGRVRPQRAVARHRGGVGGAGDRAVDHRGVRGRELGRAVDARRGHRRRRLRRRVPGLAARVVDGDPARAPRAGDVRVLRRRVRLAVAARRAG